MKYAIIVLILILLPFVFASEELSLEEKTELCINESNNIIVSLKEDNFSYRRIEDLMKNLNQNYDIQSSLKESNKSYNFSIVIENCEEIKNVYDLALQSRDSLVALEMFYEEFTQDVETETIDVIIDEIKNEISRERYELVEDLIEKAYEEIILVKSQTTTMAVFYDVTSRGIKRFLKENGLFLLINLILIVIIFLIMKDKIKTQNLLKKIQYLELRKRTLKDLIKKNQNEYFNKGKISEENFSIKNKKLAELVRDIDRQIPLLKEEIGKYKKTKNS